jgi:MFS family permease
MSEETKNNRENEDKSVGQVLRESLKEVVDPFINLVKMPRSLWGINISYVLEGLVYFGILTILGKYLSEDVGLKDLHAGWVYSALTGGITLSMLFLGGVADKIGVRKAMLFSLGIMIFGRLVLAASGTFFAYGQGPASAMFVSVLVGLLLVVVGYGMYQPAAYAGVKQFTDEKTSAMGYAMIYGLMNLGAFFSGIMSPPIRQAGGMVAVFWVYVVLTVLAFLAVLFILSRKAEERDTVVREEKGDQKEGEDKKKKAAVPAPSAPLLSPRFFAYLAGVTAAVAALVYLVLSSSPAPLEPQLDRIQDELRASAKSLGEAAEAASNLAGARKAKEADQAVIDEAARMAGEALQKTGEQLKASAAVVLTAAGEVAVPARLPETAAVDAGAYALLAKLAQVEGRILERVARRPESYSGAVAKNTPAARGARDRLRSLGIIHMSLAYALVDKVDAGVVDTLQKRMKLVEEEKIPLPDSTVELIVELSGKPLVEMLAGAVEQTRQTARKLSGELPGVEDLLVELLLAEADILEAAAAVTGAGESVIVKELVKERMILSSVYLIRDAAPLLISEASALEAPAEEPKSEEVEEALEVEFLQARVAAAVGYIDHQRSAAAAASRLPLQSRAVNWGLRYGLLSLVALLFLFLLVRNLLGKRPDHPFHNGPFVFFIFILIPVQTLFAHNWLTLPYYINRAFGGTAVGDNFEFFSNINPILIFFLAPMVAALTAKRNVYAMMIWGTLVMAVPTFLLVLPPSPTMLLTYILLMSIGEAMWQPRFLQWVAEIAPEGKTGAYMGIAQFPWFMTKVITGLYSGYFLAQYCPMVGPQNTQMLWFIYALIAMSTPLALWLARGWMRKRVQ